MADLDPRFAQTEFVVEATSAEQLFLWGQYASDSTMRRQAPEVAAWLYGPAVKWEQDNMGCWLTIGHVADMPICLSFLWSKLNGHLVLFYESTSVVVYYHLVQEWLDKHCCPLWDGGTRKARSNAMNFHLCLEVCCGIRR